MKTAKEMKEIAYLGEIKNLKYSYRKAKRMIKKQIYPAIKDASKRGEYHIYFVSYELDSATSKQIKEMLENLDYKVRINFATLKIIWE